MSDALAILDGVAACVSVMLMPEELEGLINFLRGESWEEIVPPSVKTSSTTAAVEDAATGMDTRRYIPNVLTACYNYIPLAIAADVSLVSSSSTSERSTLVHKFERHDFRVFVVNLMPEGRTAENPFPYKSGGNSNSIIRLNCMEAVQAWCDSVYAEKGGTAPCRSQFADAKRSRYEEASRNNTAPSAMSHKHASNSTSELCSVRRVLLILRCCANENPARRDEMDRSSRTSDPLMMFLHDISAMTALCRAREATYRVRIQFAVLLLPGDLAYGGSLLEESLREPLGREYCVRIFRGFTAGVARRGDGEKAAFIRQLEKWMNVPTAAHAHTCDVTSGASVNDRKEGENDVGRNEQEQQQQRSAAVGMDVELEEKNRRHESCFFFLRCENLPFCCFLREALRRFPVILNPISLRQMQALWAARRQLRDVVTGMHALLCPFAYSSSSSLEVPLAAEISSAAKERRKIKNDEMLYHHLDIVDILNAIFSAAGQLAEGDVLNEAVTFAVLYEDIVWKRPMRLQRIPDVVSVFERLWSRWGNDTNSMVFHEALALCVPVHVPSNALQNECYRRLHEAREETRAVVEIPAAMRMPGAKVPLGSELMQAALLAVLPPQESLEELKNIIAVDKCRSHRDACRGNDGNGAVATAPKHQHQHQQQQRSLSANNFFNPSIPDAVRLLHLLTSHALGQATSRQKYVSFEVLRRVCQISDEALLRALKELQLAGMVVLSGRELKAKIVLDV